VWNCACGKNDVVYRWFLARCNPVCDDRGQVTRWYVACADIEDRKGPSRNFSRGKNVALREEIDKTSMFEEIVGTSRPLRAVLSRIAKFAPTDSTVLIQVKPAQAKSSSPVPFTNDPADPLIPSLASIVPRFRPRWCPPNCLATKKGAFTGGHPAPAWPLRNG